MTTTTEQRLERHDREVEQLKRSFVEAIQHLQGAPEVDASFGERLDALVGRFQHLRTDLQPEDFDKAQLDLEACDQLLIRIERIRHVMRDALDEHVTGVGGDTAAVMEELSTWLPTTTRHELAELLGVDRRTLPRWEKQRDRAPSRRLQAVARLVAILRHSWTEQGILAWFHRPRRELGGLAPLELLDDTAFDEEALIAAARAGRSQYAA
jgi:transcriptional regulator with XRE-family HTH domain